MENKSQSKLDFLFCPVQNELINFLFQMYCVSLPLVFLCVVAAFVVMFASFWFENMMIENRRDAGDDSVFAYVLTSIPGAVYGVVVWIMNIYYRYFATVLTEWGMFVNLCCEILGGSWKIDAKIYTHKKTQQIEITQLDHT